MSNRQVIGLYIHFPFCKKKCNYCDFYSVTADPHRIRRYADAVIYDLQQQASLFADAQFDSLFVGGGTPSVGGEETIRIIQAALQAFSFTDQAEITCEANPESLHKTFIEQLATVGVNRMSLGAQSFCDQELQDLGRIHNKDAIINACREVRCYGIENINIDLMFGIGHKTCKKDHLKAFSDSLDDILKLNIPHISCYNLTVQQGTPLCQHLSDFIFPDEDTEEEMYRTLCRRLGQAGYGHYEISNFAKEDYECKHNLKYWMSKPYLGIGPSAHSFINNTRYSVLPDVEAYINGEKKYQLEETLSSNQLSYERLVTGLRLHSGITFQEISEYIDIEALQADLPVYEKHNYIQTTAQGFALTETGFRISNALIRRFCEYKKSDC